MRDVMRSIREHDPAIKSMAEVFLYPGFWAIFFHRIAHPLYKIHWYFLARLISQISRGLTGIEIHPGAKLGKGLFIDHGMGIVIGETCEVGENVLIYQGVTLGGTGKDMGKRHPTIGNNVMIGAGAKVLGPFTVGDNSQIGAGSVVLQEVPFNSTVVGVPGRVIVRKDNTKVCDMMDQVRLSDPVKVDIDELMKHIEELKEKVEKLERKSQGESL